jgi:hypothetical protein
MRLIIGGTVGAGKGARLSVARIGFEHDVVRYEDWNLQVCQDQTRAHLFRLMENRMEKTTTHGVLMLSQRR